MTDERGVRSGWLWEVTFTGYPAQLLVVSDTINAALRLATEIWLRSQDTKDTPTPVVQSVTQKLGGRILTGVK